MKKNEKGVALLMALGFVALLLVLIMGFATNSLLEKKVANVNANRSQAKILAESALNRAIAAMRYQIHLQSSLNYDAGLYRFDNVVSKTNTNILSTYPSNDIEYHGILDSFRSLSDGNYYLSTGANGATPYYAYIYPLNNNIDYSLNNDTNNANANKNLRQPQWQYLTNGTEVTGRFMYAVLPDMGRIPYGIGAIDSTKDGTSINELSIENLQFNLPVTPVGAPLSLNLASYRGQFFATDPQNKYHIEQIQTSLNDIQTFFARNMIETQASVSDLNTKYSKYNANMILFSELTKILEKYKDITTLAKIEEAREEIKTLSPFFRRIDDTKLNHIVANMLDYYDADNVPTSDVDPENWGITSPTITGNEKTPYINEIVMTITPTINVTRTSRTTPSGTEYDYTIQGKFVVEFVVEICNYNENITLTDYQIKNGNSVFKLDCRLVLGEGASQRTETKYITATPMNASTPWKIGQNVGGNNINMEYASLYKEMSYETTPFTVTATTPTLLAAMDFISIRNFGNYILSFNGKNVDFVGELGEINTNVSVPSIVDYQIAGNATDIRPLALEGLDQNWSRIIRFMANDARCNTDTTDSNKWKSALSHRNKAQYEEYMASTEDEKDALFNVRSKNSISEWVKTYADPITDFYDADTSANPLKTHRVGNSNSFSLDELGFINTGEPWQTLTISKANGDFNKVGDTSTNVTNGNVGSLLDEFTMMSDTSPQLVDINTTSVNIWRALLTDIRDIDGNVILSPTAVDTSAQNIARNIRTNKLFFKSRSGIIRPINEVRADIGLNDPVPDGEKSLFELSITGWNTMEKYQRDALVAKILPLCKTEEYPEFVQVLVIAQTIKKNQSDTNLSTYNPNLDTITSECKFIAKLRRNGNRYEIQNIEYLID